MTLRQKNGTLQAYFYLSLLNVGYLGGAAEQLDDFWATQILRIIFER